MGALFRCFTMSPFLRVHSFGSFCRFLRLLSLRLLDECQILEVIQKVFGVPHDPHWSWMLHELGVFLIWNKFKVLF